MKQFYLKCCWNVATENLFMKYSCKTLCLRYCFVEVRVFLLFSINDVKKSYQFRELFLSLLLLFKLIRSPKINIGRLDAIFSRIATGLSAFNKNTGVMVMLIFLHGKWASNRKVQGSKNKYSGFSVLQVKEDHGWELSLVSAFWDQHIYVGEAVALDVN